MAGSTSPLGIYYRFAPHSLLAVSILVLGTAIASERWGGLLPCPLCLWQRWPYWVVIALMLIAIMVPPRKMNGMARAGLMALAGGAFVIGAGIAGFHVGVEQGWWPGLSSCGAAGPSLQSGLGGDDLRQQLMDTPVVRCDRPAWTLFGISMAGYNFAVSIILGWAAFAAALRAPRIGG